MKNLKNSATIIKILISVISVVIIILELATPNITIPSTIIFALLVCGLPWVSPLFKAVEIPGLIKVEFNDRLSEDLAKTKANEAIKETSKSQLTTLKWDKVATLFWLGNDLMWVQDQMHKINPPQRVSEGVDHCIQYVVDLGFTNNSMPVRELKLASNILQPLIGLSNDFETDKTLLEQHYKTVEQSIRTVKWYIDALATQQQTGFEKLRSL